MSMKPEAFSAMSYDEQSQAIQKYMVKLSQAPKQASHSCGDGRKAKNGEYFIKNFGGSLGAATVLFVSQWRSGSRSTYGEVVESALERLKLNFDLGGHRDEHNDNNPTTSGCGYADNRKAIVSRIANTENFDEIINSVFKDAINDSNRSMWDGILNAYKEIAAQQEGEFTPNGEQLINKLEARDSSILVLEGEHEEYAIVFNYAPGHTLDTNRLVDDGGSAFCVDVWDAQAQTDHLGINSDEAMMIHQAEWVATALVLVVDKGNPLPPIFFVPADFSA